MRTLNYELKQLCLRNPDGSYGTRANRASILDLVANQLHEMGFRHMRARSFKPKHVEALVSRWKSEQIAPGTFKNRMSALRWLAEKTRKVEIVARANVAYDIPRRVYVTNVSRASELPADKLGLITDPYSRMSLRLERGFGFRREESIKFCPATADRGDHVNVFPTWAKGKRGRNIPIRNVEQRQLLEEAKKLAGKGSLIPKGMSYIQQLRRFVAQCEKAGIQKVHGLRHHYAQQRYRELTGWTCPAAGGPKSKQLTAEQKTLDRSARLQISNELGHSREQITAIYLGR